MYITWTDLLLVIGFIMVAATCIYLINLIKNVNDSVKVVKGILKENQQNIDKTLKDLPVISDNMVEISNSAKEELKMVESTIRSINETVEMTSATAHTLKNDVLGKIKSIVDLIDLVKKLFFKNDYSEEKDE